MTIQMKVIEQYFPVVPFITLCGVVLMAVNCLQGDDYSCMYNKDHNTQSCCDYMQHVAVTYPVPQHMVPSRLHCLFFQAASVVLLSQLELRQQQLQLNQLQPRLQINQTRKHHIKQI